MRALVQEGGACGRRRGAAASDCGLRPNHHQSLGENAPPPRLRASPSQRVWVVRSWRTELGRWEAGCLVVESPLPPWGAQVNGARGASCHGVMESLECLSAEYREEAKLLFDKYYPLEICEHMTTAQKLPLMMEWCGHTPRPALRRQARCCAGNRGGVGRVASAGRRPLGDGSGGTSEPRQRSHSCRRTTAQAFAPPPPTRELACRCAQWP